MPYGHGSSVPEAILYYRWILAGLDHFEGLERPGRGTAAWNGEKSQKSGQRNVKMQLQTIRNKPILT